MKNPDKFEHFSSSTHIVNQGVFSFARTIGEIQKEKKVTINKILGVSAKAKVVSCIRESAVNNNKLYNNKSMKNKMEEIERTKANRVTVKLLRAEVAKSKNKIAELEDDIVNKDNVLREKTASFAKVKPIFIYILYTFELKIFCVAQIELQRCCYLGKKEIRR